MITITSKDNPTYKSWTKLLKKKYRNQSGLFLVEEVNLVEEAILCNADIQAIIVREDMADALPERIANKVDIKSLYTLPKELFDKINTAETTRGVMAVIKKNTYTAEDLLRGDRSKNIVVVEKLQDPGNLGTIIRTADAAGMGGVVVLPGTVDPYSAKVLRSSAGSIYRIPVVEMDSLDVLKSFCIEREIALAVTCLDGSSDLYVSDLSKPVCIVIGNEAAGVSEEMIENADIKVRIPMYGSIESLNASVAGAIVMYEVVRQQGIIPG